MISKVTITHQFSKNKPYCREVYAKAIYNGRVLDIFHYYDIDIEIEDIVKEIFDLFNNTFRIQNEII